MPSAKAPPGMVKLTSQREEDDIKTNNIRQGEARTRLDEPLTDPSLVCLFIGV